MRNVIDFNNHWMFEKPGEPPCAVTLPHTWNAMDGQDGGNDYWRGTATYTKRFPKPAMSGGEHVFIEFCGAAMICDVSVNGIAVAHHEGGYSAFRTDLTEYLQDENELSVSVNNAENDKVYPQKADFTFYGGLYRDGRLIIVPQEHFELIEDGAPGIKVTPVVDLETRCAAVTVETRHNAKAVTITVNGESKTVESSAEFVIENVHLWDGVNDPYLYTATATLESGDSVSARFGCRTIRFDPEQGFFLNGRSYPLRGVSRHQDRSGLGNALTMKEHREDVALIREIGANTVRLAHYQQAQEFYDLCDEAGLIVWAEIPYITMHMPNGRQNTLDQMRELIEQSYNHPSIVCWGLSNEITSASPVDEDMLENHRLLNALCHSLDPTRPTAMAHVFMLEMDSPMTAVSDIGSYNLYFGWYVGELEQNDQFFDAYHAKYPDRVIGFSEYGADANVCYHSDRPTRGDYSEEYQCVYHEHMLDLIEERPYLWATHVWNMFDFAADGRDEGGRHGVNQKGLVSMDRRIKKDAFYLYKAAWSQEAFVHLCGKRYIDRVGTEAGVKVYANCDTVELYVDGILFATKRAKRVFRFTIPISGEHEIKAVGGGCEDVMHIRKVEQPNPDYAYGDTGDVTNWFEAEGLKEGYFSVNDRPFRSSGI